MADKTVATSAPKTVRRPVRATKFIYMLALRDPGGGEQYVGPFLTEDEAEGHGITSGGAWVGARNGAARLRRGLSRIPHREPWGVARRHVTADSRRGGAFLTIDQRETSHDEKETHVHTGARGAHGGGGIGPGAPNANLTLGGRSEYSAARGSGHASRARLRSWISRISPAATRCRLPPNMTGKARPPLVKAWDAQQKAARLPRIQALGPPPEDLSAAQARVWDTIVRSAPTGLLGAECRGTLKLLCVQTVLHDCDLAELTLLEAKAKHTAKQHQRRQELRRSIRMTTNTLAMLSHNLGLTPRGRKGLQLPPTGPPAAEVSGLEQMLRELDEQGFAERAAMAAESRGEAGKLDS